MEKLTSFVFLLCIVTLLVVLYFIASQEFLSFRNPSHFISTPALPRSAALDDGEVIPTDNMILCKTPASIGAKSDGNWREPEWKNRANSTFSSTTLANILKARSMGVQGQTTPWPAADPNFTFPMLESYIKSKVWPAYNRTTVDVNPVQVKTILFHNIPEWIKANADEYFKSCDVKACFLTTDRNQSHTADAVIYHLPWLYDPRPPAGRPTGQIWVAYGLESPVHHRGQHKNREWRDVFNWTMTYRLDSDLFQPYAMLVRNINQEAKNYTQIALGKNKSAAWFVSNCLTQSKRDQYVKRMQTNLAVDVFGKCGALQCADNCDRLLSQTYRFYLSFENTFCRDYVTEKLFKIYGSVDVVPVVRGGADYKKNFPPGTFIDASDFSGPESLAVYLKNLEKDIAAYTEFLRNKDKYRMIEKGTWCKLCEMLHFEKKVKWYPDFPAWLSDGVCREPTDL